MSACGTKWTNSIAAMMSANDPKRKSGPGWSPWGRMSVHGDYAERRFCWSRCPLGCPGLGTRVNFSQQMYRQHWW